MPLLAPVTQAVRHCLAIGTPLPASLAPLPQNATADCVRATRHAGVASTRRGGGGGAAVMSWLSLERPQFGRIDSATKGIADRRSGWREAALAKAAGARVPNDLPAEERDMLWSSVPQLRWHVTQQVLVTWIAIAAMGVLFWYQPTIVGYVHGLLAHETLLGPGFVSSEFADRVLDRYFSYGWWSLLIAWGTLEVGGFFLVWRYKAKPDEYPDFQARLQRLAEEAGVRPPTLIILRGLGRVLNAAATQSILSGPKVIVMGDIVETLTDPEETYVTAHELSHIKHLDIVAAVFVGAGNSAISIQKWAIVTSAVYGLFEHGWRAVVYLAVTWAVLSVTHTLYKLLAAAHSRSREYLADVGAVKIAGWDGRVSLITGLARIHHAMTRWRPFRIFQRTGTVFSTHPDIEDRAQALKLEPRVLADGNVEVGGIVIAAAHA
jgi:Zn-dependent protease with chaperone function